MRRKKGWMTAAAISAAAALMISGCGSTAATETAAPAVNSESEAVEAVVPETETEEAAKETYENSEDGGHAILADGETAEYQNAVVIKTGDSEGDEADFYGENAAVFATNGATLTLSNMEISSDGAHANGVFSYGEGTTVNISDSTIDTAGNCSGGIMTTGGAAMNASNLTIHTTGNSSAAIRSDRGGGTVTVTGGEYTTDGVGSPAVYSTADITVSDAILTSTASEGIVVEGKNSVTLKNVTLNADNNQHNSDKSDLYHGIMIYQSMSGDADTGLSEFSAEGGSIINANGDLFFVNNTATDISLTEVEITNNGDGAFLRAAAAGWGNEGENGGKVNLNASSQKIDGDIIVDDISTLNLYLKEGSTFSGAINPEGDGGEIYVELSGGAKWTLTSDSYISSLTCEADSIDLNGHKLMVNGEVYAEGTESKGEAMEIAISASGNGGEMEAPPEGGQQPAEGGQQPPEGGEMNGASGSAPSGEAPTPPEGGQGMPGNGGQQPPEKPQGGEGGKTPPEKPE